MKNISMFMLAAVMLTATCAPNKDPIPVAERIITQPLQEFGEAHLYFYEKGVMRWWLDTDYMSKPLTDTGEVLVVPVRITVYDTLGKFSAHILADSGNSDSRMESFDLWGGVYIKNENGMTVRSERLKWLKNRRRVSSEEFVQIRTPKGDMLRGRGLDASDDFSRFSFRAAVTGRFPNFRKRMEEDNEKFF